MQSWVRSLASFSVSKIIWFYWWGDSKTQDPNGTSSARFHHYEWRWRPDLNSTMFIWPASHGYYIPNWKLAPCILSFWGICFVDHQCCMLKSTSHALSMGHTLWLRSLISTSPFQLHPFIHWQLHSQTYTVPHGWLLSCYGQCHGNRQYLSSGFKESPFAHLPL